MDEKKIKVNSSFNAYVEGNAIRKPQTVPEYEPQSEPQRRQKSREEIRRDYERRRAARQNAQNARKMSLGFTMMLCAVTVLCCFAFSVLVQLKTQATQRLSTIASLESQLADLKAENDLTAIRIGTSVTLDEVRQRAAELGLVYPGSEQLQYYSVESSDYMNQYSSVSSN